MTFGEEADKILGVIKSFEKKVQDQFLRDPESAQRHEEIMAKLNEILAAVSTPKDKEQSF